MRNLDGVVDSGRRQIRLYQPIRIGCLLESCLRGTLDRAVAQTRGFRPNTGFYPTPVRFCNSVSVFWAVTIGEYSYSSVKVT